jgi:drug/metabolite transporter (DMT)-like permease
MPPVGKPADAPAGRAAGHVALGFVQLCFGLFPLFGLWAMRPAGELEPLTVACWRIAFGSFALCLAALLAHGRAALVRARDLPLFLLCALLGVVLNQVLFLVGLERSTATNAGLVMCLIPVFTFAVAALVRQERFSALRGAGLCVALVGASMLFWAQKPEFRRDYGLGNLLMATNALCYSVYLVASRPLARRYPPLVTIAWVYLLALPCLPWLARGQVLVPADASARTWASLAYVLVFPTTLAYLLNVFALSRLRASTTAVYVYLQPVVAGLAGWLVLHEEPTKGLVAAALLIFIGIALVARRPAAERPAAPLEGGVHGDAERP